MGMSEQPKRKEQPVSEIDDVVDNEFEHAIDLAAQVVQQWDNHDKFRIVAGESEPDGVKIARALLVFQPLSVEECEAALDDLDDTDCEPFTPEQLEHGVKYATDDKYRANWLKQKFDEQCRVNRGLRVALAKATPPVAELPPGPWTYMPNKFDDWGQVRDANGDLVADTCPGMNGEEFSKANPEHGPVRRAGPPEARAIAELLIWARSQSH